MLLYYGKHCFLTLLKMLLLMSIFSALYGASHLPINPVVAGHNTNAGLLTLGKTVAEAEGDLVVETPLDNSSFILAADRTYRRDPLDGDKHYTGGWNLHEEHYWASVGFTAAPLFIIAAAWFLGFGLVLLFLCCHYCCCGHKKYSYSRAAYTCSLVCLILFTVAVIVGCIILYTGQGKFYNSTKTTLDFVVEKANATVETLGNFSDSLSAAKEVRVMQFFLSAGDQSKIDAIETKLNQSADYLSTRTRQNSKDIHYILDLVRYLLIVIAAVMLLLAFLGFLFSLFGLQSLVYILVLIGWILVTATFILSGVFLLLHNAVGDTCVAMDDWVQNPHARTSLDNILPCVDVATAEESLNQSRRITLDLVNGINQVITKVANRNFPPGLPSVSYNQSGPSVPTLCSPWRASDLSDTSNQCAPGQVNFDNASKVWESYVCKTYSGQPGSEICKSTGRLNPDVYSQLRAAIMVSSGIHNYSPFLLQLEDCSFARDTFSKISARNCPDLQKFSKWVYLGLTVVSAAVMLSLIFWVIYARERRHRGYSKQFMMTSSHAPVSVRDKTP